MSALLAVIALLVAAHCLKAAELLFTVIVFICCIMFVFTSIKHVWPLTHFSSMFPK